VLDLAERRQVLEGEDLQVWVTSMIRRSFAGAYVSRHANRGLPE